MICNNIHNQNEIAPDGLPVQSTGCTALNTQKKQKRSGKKNLLIFLSGLLIGAVLFTALFATVGSGFFTGTVGVRPSSADTIINAVKSGDLVVVFSYGEIGSMSMFADFEMAYNKLIGKYNDKIKFYKFDVYNSHYYNLENRYLCYFNALSFFVDGQMLIYMQSGLKRGNDFIREVDRYFVPDVTVPDPNVYEMFSGRSFLGRPLGYEGYDVIGEVRLFATETVKENYQKCDGRTLEGFRYSILAKQYGSWDKDNVRLTLPNLDDDLSSLGIYYYVCANAGLAPDLYNVLGEVIDGIKYEKCTKVDIKKFYVGEIKLAEKESITANNGYLILCDGSELNIADYQELYAKIGTSFGGDGTVTFKLPNLSGKSPMVGAEYYICFKGI